jgi:TonB family protein
VIRLDLAKEMRMNRTHTLALLTFRYALISILSGCAAQGSTATSTPPTPAPIAAPNSLNSVQTPSPGLSIKTAPRVDPNHPLRIGEEYYPIESRKRQEEGICVVRLQVDADGYIRATQLLSSTGFDRLNAACLAAFADGRLLPATIDGRPVAAWTLERVVWKLTGNRFPLTPQIREDYRLKVGLDDYPAVSRKLHQEGDCVVHVDVAKDGSPTTVTLTKPTGYEPLDQACLSAVSQAQFIPARQGPTAIAASTDINISWRLPTP